MTELEVFTKCVSLGMTKAGAAGCTANILHESNGRPNNVENTCPLSDEEYTRRVDDGGYTDFAGDAYGYGICQWTYYTRKEALLKYAREHGVSIADEDMQFQFMARELRERYAFVWNTLITTSDPYEAGYVMCEKFERPKGGETSAKQRGNKAREIYERCKDKEEAVYYNPQKVIDVALSQVGYHEKASNNQLDDFTANAGDKNFTKYARDMDALKGFYNGPKQGFAYCDVFTDWAFVQAYGRAAAQYLLCQPDNSSGAGCSFSAKYFDAKGQFHKSNPNPGDQIFFGHGWDNVYHTGIVVEVTSTHVITVEGNASDMVAKRKYALNDQSIFGYGRPKWGNPEDSEAPAPAPTPSKHTYTVQLPLLKKGDRGDYVKTLQYLLIAHGRDLGTWGADGDFGRETELAVCFFQSSRHLDVDGEVGFDTWNAALSKW